MPKFEDRLWSDLVREHGSELAMATPRVPRARRPRTPLAAAALALAAALIAAILIFTAGGRTTQAYAVTTNADGTVTVTIRQLVGVSGANAKLAKLGVPVTVATVKADCAVGRHSTRMAPQLFPRVAHPTKVDGTVGMRIDPSLIPAGDTLRLAAEQVGNGTPAAFALQIALYRGPAPTCVRPSENHFRQQSSPLPSRAL
ncbi:MAG TPA: hypothetical protein VIJ39_08435 [Solirubrobacteraceae bacterium]